MTVGADATGELLVVVYTQPDHETCRIISARTATRAERRTYEEE
ncbi:MAG: BrnT family toxin [Phycisphaerales bacterium]|nr:BrnT family toxin [Phycisphaerales bacterium]